MPSEIDFQPIDFQPSAEKSQPMESKPSGSGIDFQPIDFAPEPQEEVVSKWGQEHPNLYAAGRVMGDLGASIIPITAQNEPVEEWGKKYPTIWAAAKTADRMARSVIGEKKEEQIANVGATIVSAVLGPEAFPVSYQAIKQTSKAIDSKTEEVSKELKNVATELTQMYILQKGLNGVGAITTALDDAVQSKSMKPMNDLFRDMGQNTADKLDKFAKWLYKTTYKPSTALPPEKRAQIVEKALKYGIKFNEEGYQQAKERLMKEPLAENRAIVNSGDMKGERLDTGKVIRSLADYAESIRDVVGWQEARADVYKVLEQFQKDMGGVASPTVPMGQRYKESIYGHIGDHYGEKSSYEVEALKRVGRALREGIEEAAENVDKFNKGYGITSKYAETIKKNNKIASDFLDIQGSYARATNRIENHNPVGLTASIGMHALASGSPYAAAANAAALANSHALRFKTAEAAYRLGKKIAPAPMEQMSIPEYGFVPRSAEEVKASIAKEKSTTDPGGHGGYTTPTQKPPEPPKPPQTPTRPHLLIMQIESAKRTPEWGRTKAQKELLAAVERGEI